MKKLLLAASMLTTLAILPAKADAVLTLTGPINGNILGPQSTEAPCIIAAQNCHNPTNFGYNNFAPNNATSLNRWSTAEGGANGVNVPEGVQGTPYNAAALAVAAGGVSFSVGIDVNTTNEHGETLQLFEVWDTTTNTRLYHYDGPTNIGNIFNNGNGWADFTLGTINLLTAGVLATDGILFHGVWNGASDGGEHFFLVNGSGGTQFCAQPPCNVAIPFPIAGTGIPGLVAACLGMFGIRTWRRRRKLLGLT